MSDLHETLDEYDAAPEFLPLNYLPVALPYLRRDGSDDLPGQSLVTLEDPRGMRVGAMTPEQVTNRDILSSLADRMNGGQTAFTAGNAINPVASGRISGLEYRTAAAALNDSATSSLVVIDTGIAFWNPAFRDAAQPQFRALGYFQSDLAYPRYDLIQHDEIAAYCAMADQGKEEQLLTDLAADFPDSFFGQPPDPEGQWHGTAVTDLAWGGRTDRRLFGIELPLSVLRDRSGDSLRHFLTPALNAALVMTANHADQPTTILLAFGFPGGPHDGSHPAAQILAKALASTRREVHLALPAGNHLQDRCHAQLPAGGQAITWRLAPEDYSANTIELCSAPEDRPKLRLTTPQGRNVAFKRRASGEYLLQSGHEVIGALLCTRTGLSGRSWRLRLSLGPTVAQSGLPALPEGDWRLEVTASHEVGLWILRDDNIPALDLGMPYRASVFVDPAYCERDDDGQWLLDDSYARGLLVRRAGTVSVMTTAQGAIAVGADEAHSGGLRPAYYSGQPEQGGIATSQLVDKDPRNPGQPALANGSNRQLRFSGTSAAVALHARTLP